MIKRYARPQMARVWSDERRLDHWLEVELTATECREESGEVAAGTTKRLRARCRVDVARMLEIEAEVHHDVIAFLSMIAESGGSDARHLHAGLTSSDLVDTALARQIVEAGHLALAGLEQVRGAALDLARRYRTTPMVGRTHGVHAEPITMGFKCLGWAQELGRAGVRLRAALADAAVGKLSGAVGSLAHFDRACEERALERLGLSPEPVATQVVARDRHAALMSALAIAGGAFERIALEIRHLQRTEVREAAEPFARKQKGSSAMPHKRNPIRCERICGLARLLRGFAQVSLENQALWHERDISHSSVERVTIPDAFLTFDFMAAELAYVLGGLQVFEARMRQNLEVGGGLVFSQRVLLALTEAGLSRDEAYAIVQEHALRSLDGQADFRAGLEQDRRVTDVLNAERLACCFELGHFLRGIDSLYARAGAS